MRPTDDIKRFIDKAAVRTNPTMDETILDKVLAAQEKATNEDSAALGPSRRSKIMKMPIIKSAVAATVLVAAGLGIWEFIGTGSKSGVVWAEVIKKMEASRGLIYRERGLRADEASEGTWVRNCISPTRARTDTCKGEQVVRSIYLDYDTMTMAIVQHDKKFIWKHPMENRDREDMESALHLKDWVEKALSREHTMLGQRMIDGMLCEGIEAPYSLFGDSDTPLPDGMTRIWVSVATGYPVLCEGGKLGDGGERRVETVLDQFQWDVELAASEFEPNVPPDYEQM